MSGQLRLETISLTRRDVDDFWTMKSKSFGKSATHSMFIERIDGQESETGRECCELVLLCFSISLVL